MGKHSEWRQSEAGQEGAYREMTENIKNKKLILWFLYKNKQIME